MDPIAEHIQAITRRHFFAQCGLGVGAVALTSLWNEGQAAPAARKPHFAAKAKAVICLFMYGGVSQVDTWDPKPELVRRSGQPMPNIARSTIIFRP